MVTTRPLTSGLDSTHLKAACENVSRSVLEKSDNTVWRAPLSVFMATTPTPLRLASWKMVGSSGQLRKLYATMMTSKRPESTAWRMTRSSRGVCDDTPRKRSLPCSLSRSNASWMFGFISRSMELQAWMCAKSR